MRRFWTAGALAALGAMAACSSPSAATHAVGASGRAATSNSAAPASSASRARSGAGQATAMVPALPPKARITLTRVRTADGSLITIATIQGPVRYVLHNGSGDPGPTAARLVRAGPAVTGSERRKLLAAFNGGFELSAGVGGYEQEGHLISPLRRGLASLVIDRSGHATIGVWGAGAPAAGEAVYSVRQNLRPLVLNGKPAAAAADWHLWGATLSGGEYVARSALGENASGDLIYAASMYASPAGLAAALARGGARIAMELDINPEWVQLDIAARPGGSLRAAVPGQNRPAAQYLKGWTRDFIAVLAPSGSARPPGAQPRS